MAVSSSEGEATTTPSPDAYIHYPDPTALQTIAAMGRDIDALMTRLDLGLASERAAMDDLLRRMRRVP